MTGNRASQALARIEAAAARIDAAGTRESGADGALAAKHQALRDAVSLSLQELDSLIAGTSQ